MTPSISSKELRILVLTTSYPRSAGDDAGIFVARLVEALRLKQIRPTVLVPRDGNEPLREDGRGVSIARFCYGIFRPGQLAFGAGIVPNIRNNPLLVLQLPALILCMAYHTFRKSAQHDLMYANWILAGCAAWLVHFFTKAPYVISLRGSDVALLAKIRPLARAILMTARQTVVVSDQLAEEVLRILPELKNKLSVIYNGVVSYEVPPTKIEVCRTQYQLNNRPYLIFVGSIITRKRIEVLLDIMGTPQLENFQLVLCGRTDESNYVDTLKAQIVTRNLTARVSFLGLVPPADIPALLAGAAAYITASNYEGRPNSVLEAFAAKIPVIASNIPAHQELITDGENGIIFEPQEVTGAAERIATLIADTVATKKITTAAASRIGALSWENCAQKYTDIFLTALKQ